MKALRCMKLYLGAGILSSATAWAIYIIINYDTLVIRKQQQNVESLERYLDAHSKKVVDQQDIICPFTVIEDAMEIPDFSKCQRVVYNRVPKCGSRTVHFVLERMSKKHSFNFYPSPIKEEPIHTFEGEMHFIRNVSSLDPPFIYQRHHHFVNFSRFSIPQPIYINVIRDPVERLISHYNYKRFGSASKPKNISKPIYKQSLDECVAKRHISCFGSFMRTLPYFLGSRPYKKDRYQSSQLAKLVLAKRAVSENYLAVGLTEDMEGFFSLMQQLLPQFFTGSSDIFSNIGERSFQKTRTLKKEKIQNSTRKILEAHLASDIEFYQFVRQRFYEIFRRTTST